MKRSYISIRREPEGDIMSLGLLSAPDRKRTLRRKTRRETKHLIAQELTQYLIDEALDNSSFDADETELAFYQIADYEIEVESRRREDILNGINPETQDGFSLEEFELAIEQLSPLTPKESSQAHSTWFNIEYYGAWMREMDAELTATNSPQTPV